MELITEAKWGNTNNLFFDDLSKCLFYIHQDRLHFPGGQNSINLSPYSSSFSKPILKASIDELREVLVCQFKPQKLKILGIKMVKFFKLKLHSPILGFHLARNRAVLWDLCVITTSTMEFYKLEEEFKPNSKKNNPPVPLLLHLPHNFRNPRDLLECECNPVLFILEEVPSSL